MTIHNWDICIRGGDIPIFQLVALLPQLLAGLFLRPLLLALKKCRTPDSFLARESQFGQESQIRSGFSPDGYTWDRAFFPSCVYFCRWAF